MPQVRDGNTRINISISEELFNALEEKAGKRKKGEYIEKVLRPKLGLPPLKES